MKALQFQRSINGTGTCAIEGSDTVHVVFLEPNVEFTFTTQPDARTIDFTCEGRYYVGIGDTPIAVPTVTTMFSTVEYCPSIRKYPGGTTVRVISDVGGILQVSEWL